MNVLARIIRLVRGDPPKWEAAVLGLESGNITSLPFVRFRKLADAQTWCDDMNERHKRERRHPPVTRIRLWCFGLFKRPAQLLMNLFATADGWGYECSCAGHNHGEGYVWH